MWYGIHVDVEKQTIVINDGDGNRIASHPMPYQDPSPSRERLMAEPENMEAWKAVFDLVTAANKGRGGERE